MQSSMQKTRSFKFETISADFNCSPLCCIRFEPITSLDDQIGSKRKFGLIGISPADEIVKVRHGFGESFGLGARRTWELTVLTYKALWRMVTGKLSAAESMTGPLGIFMITSKVASFGLAAVLHLVAVLSLSLAIFNLLPVPPLDGSKILAPLLPYSARQVEAWFYRYQFILFIVLLFIILNTDFLSRLIYFLFQLLTGQ